MKKMHKLGIVGLLLLFLTMGSFSACGKAVLLKCYNPTKEADVKSLYTQKVRILTSDPFTVDIVNTEALNVPTATGIGGPKNYKDVTDGQKFTIKITVKAPNGSYEIFDYYEDEYSLNGTTHPANSSENYVSIINTHKLMDKFVNLLKQKKVNDFSVVEDPACRNNDFAVFMYCEDYNTIYSLLSSFKSEVNNHQRSDLGYCAYGVYIFTDKAAYDSVNIDKLRASDAIYVGLTGLTYGEDGLEMISGKDATRIAFSDNDFDKALFDSRGKTPDVKDYDSYKYVVFWASAEPNLDGICSLQVFGVK